MLEFLLLLLLVLLHVSSEFVKEMVDDVCCEYPDAVLVSGKLEGCKLIHVHLLGYIDLGIFIDSDIKRQHNSILLFVLKLDRSLGRIDALIK